MFEDIKALISRVTSKLLKDEDPLSENDKIVIVIGPTGTGKSSFINTAANLQAKKLEVGRGLSVCTSKVKHVRCQIDGLPEHVVFVDTPAFPNPDNLSQTDEELSAKIIKFLERINKQNAKISGILYLHKITDNRNPDPPEKARKAFRTLCVRSGAGMNIPVLLVTTMWGAPPVKNVDRKEGRMKELAQGWSVEGEDGIVLRYENDQLSAWNIVKQLLSPTRTASA